jgi:flagellar hook protein FlgE
MYAAISGLEAHQTMLDTTANNLANVDTIGYKAERTTFADELSQTINPPTAPNNLNGGTNGEQVGLGVQVASIDNLMSTGSMQATGQPLDIALQGGGFLQVANSKGAVPGAIAAQTGTTQTADQTAAGNLETPEYTRAGNLKVNSDGYLTTQSGQYVVGATAAGGSGGTQTLIQIPQGATDVAIGQDGSVTYTDPTSNATVTAGFLQLANFSNPAGLSRNGDSTWSQTNASGTATLATPGFGGTGTTISGELEMSNVDMATEFTNMITAERGYQANSKVITTADQMLQTVVNMVQG